MISSDTIGGLLDLATSILKISGNMDVLAPLLVVGASSFMAFNAQAITMKAIKLGTAISPWVTSIFQLITATSKLEAVMTASVIKTKLLQVASQNMFGVITGGIAVIGLAVTAYQACKNAQEEAIRDASRLSTELVSEAESVTSLAVEYQKLSSSKSGEAGNDSALISIKEKLVEQYGFEKDAIDGVTEARDGYINGVQAEGLADVQAKIAEISTSYDKAKKSVERYYSISREWNSIYSDEIKAMESLGFAIEDNKNGYTSLYLEADNLIDYHEKLSSTVASFQEKLQRGEKLSAQEADAYSSVDAELKRINETYSDTINIYDSMHKLLANQAILQNIQGMTYASEQGAETFKVYIDSMANGLPDVVKDDLYDMAYSLFPEYSDSAENATTANNGLNSSFRALPKTVDENKKSVEALSDAMDDFEDFGGLTTETLNNLELAFPGVTTALYDTNGEMTQAGIIALSTAGSVGKLAEAFVLLQSIASKQLEIDELVNSDASSRLIQNKMNQLSGLQDDLKDLLGSAEYTYKPPTGSPPSKSDDSDPLEEQDKLYADEIKTMENQLDYLEKSGATEEKLIEQRKKIQNKLNEQANWFRGQGEGEDSLYIVDRGSQWFDQQKGIDDELEKISNRRKKRLDDQSDIFDKDIEALEYELYLMEQRGASKEELIAQEKKIQDALHKQANWFRDEGEGEESEYIKDRTKLWYKYYADIGDKEQELADEKEKIRQEDLEKAKEALDKSLEMIEKYNQDVIDARKQAMDDELDALEKQKSDMETAFSYLEDKVNKEIDLVEDEMDAVKDAYQVKIDALNDENDAINEQIALEEKLEALAKAKSTKKLVYKDGQFQYMGDYDATSGAQSDLDKYNREQELAEQIEELEKSRDDELEALQDKIDGWKDYLDGYANIVDDYGDEQDKLIAEQVLGTALEKDNWDTRLSNALDFAKKYNTIMKGIGSKEGEIDAYDKLTSSDDKLTDAEIKEQMKANSEAWFGADDETKEALHEANEKLNAMLGSGSGKFNSSTGKWDSVIASGTNTVSMPSSNLTSIGTPAPAVPSNSSFTNSLKNVVYNITAPITATSEKVANTWLGDLVNLAASTVTSRG